MPLTPKEEALKKEREQRMQDRQTIELHPWRARFEALDHAGKVAVDATIPLVLWGVLASATWGTSLALFALAFFAGAAQFFYRYALYRALAWTARTLFNAARGWSVAVKEERRKAAHAEVAKQKVEEQLAAPKDSIDGVPITTIATALAASPEVPIQKTLLSLDFTPARANKIRQSLLAARFLVWPYQIGANTYALGDAPMAVADSNNGNASILHPTLAVASADDRSTLLANALKRKEGIMPDADPYIRGELTPADRTLMGRMVKYIQDAPTPKTP